MTRTRTSSALELHLPLDRHGPQPLHRQLEHGLRDAVRTGRLGALAVVPSSRALAGQLGVSRGIVVEAYEQLVAEGYLESRPGGTTRVARTPIAVGRRPPDPPAPTYDFDFRPGRPQLDQFPRAAWLRSVRRALNEAPADLLGYLDGRAVPAVRAAMAAYLNRVRGTAAHPDNVVMSAGFAQALALVARVLRASGARRIGLEDPSHPDWRAMLVEAGVTPVGIEVDRYGIRPDAVDAARVAAVVVTAVHQYPTGAVLSAERRAALLDWAERGDRLIVEDDYDAEFRYDREPIGAIQGLCPDRVVYTGSASKTLAPALRLGWLVAPPRLVEPLIAAKNAMDGGTPSLDQLAFADFVEAGELDRHLRRMRPIYRRRRDVLLESVARSLSGFAIVGASAGLHVLAWLPDDVDEAALREAAADAGIGITVLEPMWFAGRGRGGLVFGFGSIDEGRIDAGVRRLAGVVEGLRSVGSAAASGG
jgi:GntR family transcriptional regulator/MocR family aminotransferase